MIDASDLSKAIALIESGKSNEGLAILKQLEIEHKKFAGERKKQAIRLDKIIAQIRTKFPDYIYINSITQDCREKHMIPEEYSDFAIFIKGIPEGKMHEVTNYIEGEIYLKMAEEGDPLPGLYTFHSKE